MKSGILRIQVTAVVILLQLAFVSYVYGNSLQKKKAEVMQQMQSAVEVSNESQPKRAYLTFDDGPSLNTGELLDVLKENGVKATFFVIGKTDACSKQYYKRIVEEGHTLGMHAYRHDYDKIYASKEAWIKDLEELHQLLLDITGVDVKYYRFPGGSSNSVSKVPVKELISYLNQHDIRYYDWNALNEDAVTYGVSPAELNKKIVKDTANLNTAMILMHDLNTSHNTIEALPDLIRQLKEQGFELLPIDENTPLIQHVRVEKE
ncbi:MAG: polysaccharide deacetylase family protein [Lachnospiraceae bacterium]